MPNLLPPSATELSRTLDQLAEQRLDQPLPHRHSWNPWHCRADLLGSLAWGLGVDNWDNLVTEQERRQACADAIQIHRLRGTVDSDPDEDHRVPMVVIDGREISWDELGRMVAAFEGWQFKLEFRDRSDEV